MKFASYGMVAVLLGGGTLARAEATSKAGAESSRPSDDSIFGGPPAAVQVVPEQPSGVRPDKDQDAHELNAADPERDAFATGEATDNALSLGGVYYQRLITSVQRGVSAGNAPLSAPLQFDGFMDSRPNDRIRGFVDGRLFYDPALNTGSDSGNTGSSRFSSTAAAPTNLGATTSATVSSNPQVALDQAWLKFDIERVVFVTAGKQHVKWGTSRFWNPTDLLSTQKRDPLLPYDLRLGNSMVKFEVPWEAKKSALYAMALFDNPAPASTLGQLGGAIRAETLLGSAEVGAEVVARGGRFPVYGADLSAPLGPFDVYLEAACTTGAGAPNYQLATGPTPGAELSSLYAVSTPQGPFLQISGGANYSFAWKDNRQATVGAEYFYNQLGYSDASAYPILIFYGQYQPFYTGRNYAALYLTAEGPDAAKRTSYTFSTLGNLSDMSFISRIDFSWRVLTYLSFESYFDVHYGTSGGEFNFSLNTPPLSYQGTAIAAVNVPSTVADLGVGLRLSF